MQDEPTPATIRRVVATDRVPIAVTEAPAPGAPPLVLVHGIGGRAESWWNVLAPLAERFHLYAVDLRGHGGSGKPEAGYLVSDYAADLAAALDALELERPLLLGHSLGALTTMAWAAEHPDRAARIVLEDPPLRIEPEILEDFDGWMQLNAAPLEAAVAWFREEYPDWTPEACLIAAESMTSTHPAVFAELRDDVVATLGAAGTPGLDARLAQVRQVSSPILLLRGDLDLGSMTRPEDAEQLAAVAPRVTVRRVPGVGHSIHRDQPEAFLREVFAFLEG